MYTINDFFSPEEKVSLLEKQVMELIEESCFAAERSDLQMVKVLSTLNAKKS